MVSTLPLGLYIHMPWCVRKCPYCDFNSHAADGALPEREYVNALLLDLEQQTPLVAGRTVETIFIGGGTPSLFSPDAIRDLLEGIRSRLTVAAAAEITMEANPGTAEIGKFEGFREAGINRLSIGIQSFHDAHLKKLGRIHDRREAGLAAGIAREAGFENFNLDLMFGLPDQTVDEALADIRTAIGLNPTHISFYQLTLEPNTVFHKFPPRLPEDDRIWAMQQSCQALLADHGYRQYEVSAYAREGYRCRHNLNYWRFGDYLGIGAGAHGKITNAAEPAVTRTWKIKHPQHYLEFAGRPDRQGGRAVVPREDLPFEFLMNHLRLREGFAEAAFGENTGLPLAALEPALSECVAADWLERRDGIIRCTDTGWNFLDNVLQRFLN
ncbi:oxygen-independent coproporphyrinogen III oxidase [Methylocaldum marinum]|uniref:Heme chaperone HemW n=1 Tax=Methylocaldum marinum TaxID=1432792 RepID=A0A250KVT9_9GAMM|nr:radical SAM family heme chaperone HemW [Methylocaldum marinum]BBA35735.1 oxygen-independent coproporphyrinogen III oxidase [Methylocaldum marinum]